MQKESLRIKQFSCISSLGKKSKRGSGGGRSRTGGTSGSALPSPLFLVFVRGTTTTAAAPRQARRKRPEGKKLLSLSIFHCGLSGRAKMNGKVRRKRAGEWWEPNGSVRRSVRSERESPFRRLIGLIKGRNEAQLLSLEQERLYFDFVFWFFAFQNINFFLHYDS